MTAPQGLQYLPDPDEVASLIARLLPSSAGLVTGTLGPNTIPTTEQVRLITAGVGAEVDLLASGLGPAFYQAARRVVALGAGLQVAESFFAEAAEYVVALRAQFEASLARLLSAIDRAASDDGAFAVCSMLVPDPGPELSEWR